MSRGSALSVVLTVAALTVAAPPAAAEPSFGVRVAPGAARGELARIGDAGSDVVLVAARPHRGPALARSLRTLDDRGIGAIVDLRGPSRPAVWRRLLRVTAARLEGAAPEAWLVDDPTPERIALTRDVIARHGLGGQVLARARGELPEPGTVAVADGVMLEPRAVGVRGLLSRVRRAARRVDGPLWIGPVGWSSERSRTDGRGVGLRGQRRKLAAFFTAVARSGSGVDGVVWARWRDRRPRGDGFGLVRSDGGAKPALRAYRRFALGVRDAGAPSGADGAPPIGVAPAEEPTAADLRGMSAAGVGFVRLTISQEVVASQPGGGYDWSAIDREMTALGAAGITPLPTLIGNRDLVGGISADPDALAGWGRFVAAAVQRYGRAGTLWDGLPPTVADPPRWWQVWNEQNAPAFWRPQPSPRDYASLLAVSAQAIRGSDPSAAVLLGGMFGHPLNSRGIDAADFLARLYEIPGAAAHFDAIAAHPYAADLAGVAKQVDALRAVALAAGDPEVPLWVTELGWSSVPDPRPQWAGYSRTPEGQAEMLSAAGALMLKEAERWNLAGFTWYTWRDPGGSVCPFCLDAGLLEHDGTPKPALAAFTALTAAGAPSPRSGP